MSARPAPVIRLRASDMPEACSVCTTPAAGLSGLIGWHDGQPLCPGCLAEVSPELGRALEQVEGRAQGTVRVVEPALDEAAHRPLLLEPAQESSSSSRLAVGHAVSRYTKSARRPARS